MQIMRNAVAWCAGGHAMGLEVCMHYPALPRFKYGRALPAEYLITCVQTADKAKVSRL